MASKVLGSVLGSIFLMALAAVLVFVPQEPVRAGELPVAGGYRVLAPITHGNLTIFPVVAATTHDTSEFITLDEGLRSGEVVVSEAGQIQPLVRRRGRPVPYRGDGAQVNTLVLVNNSDRPLLLLAGEIVTGGKQDRIVGKDRIVPPNSDPIDLGVFCVEPHRWVAESDKFNATSTPMIVQPSVRKQAMANKDQQQVWNSVQSSIDAAAPPPSTIGSYGAVGGGMYRTETGTTTSSYARTMTSKPLQAKVDSVAAPIEHSYESTIRQLKDQHAVGVVVAVNGRIIWADLFASPQLLEKYWPKLVRSYAAEAITTVGKTAAPSEKAAQAFLNALSGTHESVEIEPGLFRQTEITGNDYHVFELTSLLPKTGFDLHISKMAED
jgi:ARG/rhodanese/phosphatase superfamily protein